MLMPLSPNYKFGLQTKLLTIFLIVMFSVLGITLTGIFSLQRITKTSSLITEKEIPNLRSIREALLGIAVAQSAMESALDIDQFSDIVAINQHEATFRKSAIIFDMYLAAVTWGSESEAFSKSDLGINAAEWQRAGLKGTFKVIQALPEEVQIAGQAGLQFAGFRNNAIKAISSHKKFLRLQDEGKGEEATQVYNEAKEYTTKARKFSEVTQALLKEIIQLSNEQIEKATREIGEINQIAYQTILVVGLAGIVLTLIFSLVSTRLVIIRPLKYLLTIAQQFGAGDLTKRVELKSSDEIGELGQAFNQMASQIQEYYGGLEQKVRDQTASLQAKLTEVEELNKVMVGRELKMVEMKKELEELKKRVHD